MSTAQVLSHKKKLAEAQKYECAICSIDLATIPTKDWCLDHDHSQGHVRGVLCRNCNGIEGKVLNLARRGARGRGPQDFLNRIIAYWVTFGDPGASAVYHPTHKTEDEKRLLRNKKTRMARAKAKAIQNIKAK